MATETQKPAIYDSIASSYDLVWAVPITRILLPLLDSTLRSLQPSLVGASVLDLACGTGVGLRLAHSVGANRLVGVDISTEMLKICRETTPEAGTQIELHQADCSKSLDHLGLEKGGFDLVIAMWLMNYAESREHLKGMWENVSAYLKPGAKYVGLIQNHETIYPTSMQEMKYGCVERVVEELENGDGWKKHYEFDTKPAIEFDGFVMRKDVLEGEAERAGMEDLKYLRPGWDCLTEDERKDEAKWRELLVEYPNQVIMATKR